MILCSACLPTHVINLVINDNSLEVLYVVLLLLFTDYLTPCRCTCLYHTWKEGNVSFNNTLNTFYLWLYGVRHMVKDHSDSERGNPLPPLHGLLFPISKDYFICTIPDRVVHITAFVTPVVDIIQIILRFKIKIWWKHQPEVQSFWVQLSSESHCVSSKNNNRTTPTHPKKTTPKTPHLNKPTLTNPKVHITIKIYWVFH